MTRYFKPTQWKHVDCLFDHQDWNIGLYEAASATSKETSVSVG